MSEATEPLSTVLLVTHDGLGQAEQPLQRRLFRIYLTLLLEEGRLPQAICFYTEGVRLALDDSPVLDLLKQLEAKGVLLISCVTCLNHYGLADRVAVGIVGGMHDILAAQWQAQKVITL